MIVPEEERHHLLMDILRNIERISLLALVVEETEKIAGDTQPILDSRDVFDGQWVWNLLQSSLTTLYPINKYRYFFDNFISL